MARRRSGKQPEEVIFGLVMLLVIYLAMTHRLGAALRMVGVLAVLVVVAAVLIRILRNKGESVASDSALRLNPYISTTPRAPRASTRPPDLLDQVRERQETERPTQDRPSGWSLDLVRALEWKRFEELCEGYWKAKGYRAELTGRGADGGIDINLYRPSAPDKLLAIIQCKSRSEDKVGVSVVRELFGVMHHVGAPMGILVTSTGFHDAAIEFAAGKHLQLVGGENLLKQLLELPADASASLLANVTRGDYLTPTCPSCDVKMKVRAAKANGSEFYGCTNFPRCRQTFQLRGSLGKA